MTQAGSSLGTVELVEKSHVSGGMCDTYNLTYVPHMFNVNPQPAATVGQGGEGKRGMLS